MEKIQAADCQDLSQWKMGSMFAAYAWNASPIDGMNIIHSFAAVGREFPFPIDIAYSEAIPRLQTSTGDATLQHIEATFPLLFQQREVLSVIQAERRRAHVELKNKGHKTVVFSLGDIVQVRKQVQSHDGVPAKQHEAPTALSSPQPKIPIRIGSNISLLFKDLGKRGDG
jgi:hypothetical protein